MSGLVLKLSAGERVLINGALVENGTRRSSLAVLTPRCHVLRMREALTPEEVRTPVRVVYFLAQQIVTGEVTLDEVRYRLARGLSQLGDVFRDAESRADLDRAARALDDGEAYTVLKALRPVMRREEALMAVRP